MEDLRTAVKVELAFGDDWRCLEARRPEALSSEIQSKQLSRIIGCLRWAALLTAGQGGVSLLAEGRTMGRVQIQAGSKSYMGTWVIIWDPWPWVRVTV